MKTINRKAFLARIGGAAACAAAAGPLMSLACGRTSSVPLGNKPNFVILFADDMGYGDWNRGGNPTIRTPNLNRMAGEGVQITQFYCANPVCSPSRSALTGPDRLASLIRWDEKAPH